MLKTAVEENLDLVTEDCARVKVKSPMSCLVTSSISFGRESSMHPKLDYSEKLIIGTYCLRIGLFCKLTTCTTTTAKKRL